MHDFDFNSYYLAIDNYNNIDGLSIQGGDTPIYPVLRSSSSVKVLTC